MHFVIDKVSEDSFYANLLLGLPETLASVGVVDTRIARRPGVPEADILQWEFKHGIRLMDDMRSFYAATDGFLYAWNLNEPDESNNIVFGKIEVNPLSQFLHVHYILEQHHSANMKLGLESKVFELCKVDDTGKVVVVYVHPHSTPNIWLCTSNTEFYHIANNFTTYIRMAVAHLGIPEWQYSFTPQGVSEGCQVSKHLPLMSCMDNTFFIYFHQNTLGIINYQ